MTKNNETVKAWVLIIESLQKYGLSIAILLTAVYVLSQQSLSHQEKLERCNENMIMIYQKQNEEQRLQSLELIRVLDKNTDAINTFSDILKTRLKGKSI